MKLETRVTIGKLELRAGADGKPIIAGYAAVYNSRSEDLGGFVETIAAGAFDRSLADGCDVRALFNHDPNLILGRNKSGTLVIRSDAHGLGVEISPPDTTCGRDLQESIRRGDISGMSFAFVCERDEWTNANGVLLRTLVDVDLYDVSPVTYPAYPDTAVAMRSMQSWQAKADVPAFDSDRLETLRRMAIAASL